MNPKLEILTDADLMLAETVLPAEFVKEGEDGDVTEIELQFNVINEGSAQKFRVIYDEQRVEGPIVEGPVRLSEIPSLSNACGFTLSRIDLRSGDVIRGVFRSITIKEGE